MGVTCQLLIQKTKEGVFRAGQPVVGTLKYKIDTPTKFTSIDICLKGKGKCQWSESDSDGITIHNKEKYVNICKSLLTGQNIISGVYERPFEFFLPENIPTSMKERNCTIEYKVVVKFVKDDFFGTKNKFDAEVLVYGYVNPCSPEPLIFGLQKKILSLSVNNNIDIKAKIERTLLTPGENIKLYLSITNDTDVPITIKTELFKYFTYIAVNKAKTIRKEPVKTTAVNSPRIKQRSVLKLKCIVPTLSSLYSIQHAKILIGEYKVRVTAKVPFPHTNAVVEVPVVIGESKYYVGAAIVGYGSSSSSNTTKT